MSGVEKNCRYHDENFGTELMLTEETAIVVNIAFGRTLWICVDCHDIAYSPHNPNPPPTAKKDW